MARGLHDPLPLTPKCARLATGRFFAVFPKSGDTAQHFFKQQLRVAPPFLCALANLPPNARKADQHVVTSAGEAFVHLPAKFSLHAREAGVHLAAHGREFRLHFTAHGREFRLHFTAHGREFRPHFTAHGREFRPHFDAYVREFNAHCGAELHNLRRYRTYSLRDYRDLRGQCLESFHGLFQAFYAIRQQFIRHHSSALTRRSHSKRALNGWTKARWMPTTLPSSRRADNGFRLGIRRWRRVDATSTLEVA